MEGAHAELDHQLLEKATDANIVQALVETKSAHSKCSKVVRLNSEHVLYFPI